MKSNILLLIFVLVTHNSYSQDNSISEKDLTGIWQAELNDFTSMCLDSYTFFEDGKFIFRPL